MYKGIRKIVSFFLILRCAICCAQPGALDLTFNRGGIGAVNTLGGDFGNSVNAICVQPDDKIIIGGSFNQYNNATRYCLARLNADGTLDTTFNPGPYCSTISGTVPEVYACALQNDGKILIGGVFNCYNNVPGSFIGRVNPDGSADTSFHTGTGFNNYVYSIAVQSDGKIVVGGIFSSYNSVTQNNITRLNTDGTLDTSFSSGTGADGTVQAIAIQQDGKILIGGNFDYYNGTLEVRLARVNTDGRIDSSFNPIFATDKAINSIAILNNYFIVIGGGFSTYQGNPRNMVAVVDPDGGVYTLFVTYGAPAPEGTEVHSVLVDNNNEILIGGQFQTIDDDSIFSLALLNDSGNIDHSFHSYAGVTAVINAMALQSDGKIIVSGTFSQYQNVTVGNIARLNACLLPSPPVIYGDSTTLCGGTITYSIKPVDSATSYIWTLPPGWTGSSDSTSITATSNGSGGIVSVAAYDDLCGYSIPQTDSITQVQPPGVPICLCTVDTQSTHNIIIWDKPQTTLIDSFFIYREITTNNYSKIAAVPYDSLSEYNDYGANPNTTSFTYKISTLDICGVESALSLYHSTINLQNLGNGNFQWTFYEIENSPNPVISFNVYRDDLGNGNFSQIGLVPGSNATFTDITYSSFPNAIYVVDVLWDISCNPTRAISTTRSNIRNGKKSLDVGEEDLLAVNIEIYPNPADRFVNLLLPSSPVVTGLRLLNALGQIVWSETESTSAANGLKQVNIENFTPGIYTLTIETSEGAINRKLIIR